MKGETGPLRDEILRDSATNGSQEVEGRDSEIE